MAGHFPFSGNANRLSVYAFFEAKEWSLEAQEAYYSKWFQWAKDKVQSNDDLNAAVGPRFTGEMYGAHAHESFHLNGYQWCTALLDLGQFINGVILPRMSSDEVHDLEHSHEAWVSEMEAVAKSHPRAAPPEVGRYRHV